MGLDYVGLGSFPRSDSPARAFAAFAAPLPLFSLILPFGPPVLPDLVFDSGDDVCSVHMCEHTSVVSPSVPAGFGKAEFHEHKCFVTQPCALGLPDRFAVLASHHLGC